MTPPPVLALTLPLLPLRSGWDDSSSGASRTLNLSPQGALHPNKHTHKTKQMEQNPSTSIKNKSASIEESIDRCYLVLDEGVGMFRTRHPIFIRPKSMRVSCMT